MSIQMNQVEAITLNGNSVLKIKNSQGELLWKKKNKDKKDLSSTIKDKQ